MCENMPWGRWYTVKNKEYYRTFAEVSIDAIEHNLEDDYEIVTYFKGGSKDIGKYEYSDIFKIILSHIVL